MAAHVRKEHPQFAKPKKSKAPQWTRRQEVEKEIRCLFGLDDAIAQDKHPHL
jgi:hypothetical protein